MAFQVFERLSAVAAHSLCTMHGPNGEYAEVCVGVGSNVLRWHMPDSTGKPVEVLYVSPDWDTNPVPTRSGNPVLFPFPNRIENGEFTWNSKTYRLPWNCPARKHAIHGLVFDRPWRLVTAEATESHARVLSEFELEVDAADRRALWPCNFVLRLAVELTSKELGFRVHVHNPGTVPLPYGFGLHPYFATPDQANTQVRIHAAKQWELRDNIPTGRRVPVAGPSDLREWRGLGALTLDDVFSMPSAEERELGAIRTSSWDLRLEASGDFRELVAFTPAHRRAVCLEPYTCTTNAVHVADSGWVQLAQGASAEHHVRYLWSSH
jgi:aldose 1-epimerase